jgi:predicted O-linked N-acetylglucosamine transferase (SPINDLY family)
VSELCVALQLATQFDSFPLSIDHADYALQKMEYYQTELLQLIDPDQYRTYNQDAAMLNEQWLSKTIPGVIQDPYVHCVNDLFTLSFYYRANVTKIASQHYKLVSLAWPGLNYIAQHVHQYKKDAAIAAKFASSNNYHHQKCIDRKIRLGVISATVTQGHSVSEDFGGVLEHLDRSKFQVTYIQVHEKSTPANSADFLTAHPDVDELFHYFKNPQTDTQNGAWIKDRIGIQEIEQKFQFDIILYLDLTMSSFMKRLGMMKLAPVQINTHGHPMTSGHPSTIIDHFISWGEAELPIEISQSHYTEQLQLIPKGKIHQYYTPRVITEETQKIVAGGGSETKTILRNRLNGQRFDHLTRKDYELPPYLQNSDLSDGRYNVYTCMQIPFKLHPEFDELVCGILNRDTNGHAILHKEVATNHHKTFVERLKQAGCDMDRVHFLSRLPQHELSQLYRLSNVVLDSYPAGGCTTTRDVLENGKVVVTWPARLLGGT